MQGYLELESNQVLLILLTVVALIKMMMNKLFLKDFLGWDLPPKLCAGGKGGKLLSTVLTKDYMICSFLYTCSRHALLLVG